LDSFIISNTYIFFRTFSFLPEFKENGKVFDGCVNVFVKIDPVFVQLGFLQDGRSTSVIIPKSGRKGKLFIVIYFMLAVLDVKETSSGQAHGPSYLSIVLVS
jgi:hypothetical protein